MAPRPFLLVLLAAAGGGLVRASVLQDALQKVLNDVTSEHPGTVLQLGWVSATERFALASGSVQVPGEAARDATVDDTFLFGSGVKPFTSAAVMSLVHQGIVSLDDPLEKHVDPALGRLHSGSTLRGLFGEQAGLITVGHTLRMQSGVQDFDFPPFDNFLLSKEQTYKVHSPYEFVEYASTQEPKLLCLPGHCVSYSSNNFVLAGFILLTHANVTDWWDLDIRMFFPEEVRASFKGTFLQREMLNEKLTVPGHTGGGWAKTPPTVIYNQSSTILGWTCGNLVATALDVASFMWDLLGPEPKVLPASTLAEMKQFKLIDQGWGSGAIQYGTGLMIETAAFPGKPELPKWGSYMGHGGDTYGFLSEQGIISGLDASMSIVANQDTDGLVVQHDAFCRAIEAAALALHSKTLSLGCRRPQADVSVYV